MLNLFLKFIILLCIYTERVEESLAEAKGGAQEVIIWVNIDDKELRKKGRTNQCVKWQNMLWFWQKRFKTGGCEKIGESREECLRNVRIMTCTPL